MDMKKGFLIFASAMVSVIALLYGINPPWFVRIFFGAANLSVDFAHILRAVMCLYLALGAFWLYCALSEWNKNTAILTTIVFAAGLVVGRLLSFAVDGLPSPLLIFYAALECAVIPLAWWVYKQPE